MFRGCSLHILKSSVFCTYSLSQFRLPRWRSFIALRDEWPPYWIAQIYAEFVSVTWVRAFEMWFLYQMKATASPCEILRASWPCFPCHFIYLTIISYYYLFFAKTHDEQKQALLLSIHRFSASLLDGDSFPDCLLSCGLVCSLSSPHFSCSCELHAPAENETN